MALAAPTQDGDAGAAVVIADIDAAEAVADIDAGEAVLDDTAVVAATDPCVGTWARSGVRITITEGDATCGTMRYSLCRGSLRRCTWSDTGLRASFACVGTRQTYTGSMRFTCTDTRMTQVDKTEGFATETGTLRRR